MKLFVELTGFVNLTINVPDDMPLEDFTSEVERQPNSVHEITNLLVNAPAMEKYHVRVLQTILCGFQGPHPKK